MLSKPGTYALIFSSSVEERITIGKIGALNAVPGWYVYVGSGRGPGGVKARVAHHHHISPNPRWHMDYLRPYLSLVCVWYAFDTEHRECDWARLFSRTRGAAIPLLKFGASDCFCSSHLFYSKPAPSFPSFKTRIRSTCLAHPKIYFEQIST
jgi:Uri superfamily endonuclease